MLIVLQQINILDSIDPTQQGYNAVTKKGGYGYDDAYIKYAPPSGGGKDSGGGDGWSGGSGSVLEEVVLTQIKQLYNYG
jgi:hypothetical protein